LLGAADQPVVPWRLQKGQSVSYTLQFIALYAVRILLANAMAGAYLRLVASLPNKTFGCQVAIVLKALLGAHFGCFSPREVYTTPR
jgi:hypothetical protein